MKQSMDKKELKECVGGATGIEYGNTLLGAIETIDPGSANFFAAHPTLANLLNSIVLPSS